MAIRSTRQKHLCFTLINLQSEKMYGLMYFTLSSSLLRTQSRFSFNIASFPVNIAKSFCLTLYRLFKTILDLQLYLMPWLKEFFLLSKYSLCRASYLLERKLFSQKSKGFQKIHFYRHISFQNHCVLVFNLISLHDAGEIFIMLNSAVNKN